VPELLEAYSHLDAARAQRVKELIETLKAWDQVGAMTPSRRRFSCVWKPARSSSVAATAKAPDLLITALEQAQSELEKTQGTWKVAWGEVNRLQRVHTSGTEEPFSDDKPSVPVPGAPTFTGTVLTFGARAVPGQKRWYGTVGNTYVAVVDFGKKPIARSLLVFGQAADPKSPHYFDQAPFYSQAGVQTSLV
jgi:acyl-homoserine lactone acylase PvdQ